MEVYLDVILIENFIIDLFLLIISFNIMKISINTKRIVISAVLGSIYTLVMIFKELKFFSTILFQFLAAYFIVLIALGIKKKLLALKTSGVFIVCAFLLSGLCYYFSQKEMEYSFVNGTTINDFSAKYLIISLMIIYICVERIYSYLKERNFTSNFIFNVEININNIKYVARGFLDTGNELREPVTNLPCILVEEEVLKDLEIPEDKTFYINYSAIGYSGKLKGVKADNVRIYSKCNKARKINAVICPCKEVLSRDREFNALLSRGVI